MISLFSDTSPSPEAPTPHATTVETQITEESTLYFVEADSPFFQLSRDTVLLRTEFLGGTGGAVGSGAGGSGGGLTARNTMRSGGGASGGGPGGGANGSMKRNNTPKVAELIELRDHNAPGVSDPEGAFMGGATNPGTGTLDFVPMTNAVQVNFYPRAAGSYPCRVVMKRRMRNMVDVRCVDIAAIVDAPRNSTALVFRAPSGQKITQEVRENVPASRHERCCQHACSTD